MRLDLNNPVITLGYKRDTTKAWDWEAISPLEAHENDDDPTSGILNGRAHQLSKKLLTVGYTPTSGLLDSVWNMTKVLKIVEYQPGNTVFFSGLPDLVPMVFHPQGQAQNLTHPMLGISGYSDVHPSLFVPVILAKMLKEYTSTLWASHSCYSSTPTPFVLSAPGAKPKPRTYVFSITIPLGIEAKVKLLTDIVEFYRNFNGKTVPNEEWKLILETSLRKRDAWFGKSPLSMAQSVVCLVDGWKDGGAAFNYWEDILNA